MLYTEGAKAPFGLFSKGRENEYTDFKSASKEGPIFFYE
jgi:hypothetical protein